MLQEARSLIEAQQPDIVVFGHSHVFLDAMWGSVRLINPGSAGPARFRLARSAAVLKLPPKVKVPHTPN
jgi:predicted phosphodiesterase